MPPRRLATLTDRCTVVVDGREVPARIGEPCANAIVASGRFLFGRSVKYHRPRGPACFAGECDGCLMRVDGVPNVMTCKLHAHDGMVLETQNVLGTADADLLSATDWFFGEGLNHHELMTRFRPLNLAMQSMARRVAGIGTLPDSPRATTDAKTLACDVLVVGAGYAGLSAAARLRARGVDVAVLEEQTQLGGHLAYAPPGLHHDQDALRAHVDAASQSLGPALRTEHLAAGFFHDGWLAATATHLLRVSAKHVVFATGAREGSLAIVGGDRPGVITSRALARLISGGILPGSRIVFVGDTRWSRALIAAGRELGATCIGPFAERDVMRVRGSSKVRGIEVINGQTSETHACDLIVTSAPLSSAYELAAQAGAELFEQGGGFFVSARSNDGVTAAPRVFAIGECSGAHDPNAWQAQANGVVAHIVKELDHVR